MKLLFLTYMNRSGSTFLANQLSRLPQVLVCPESDLLYDRFLSYPQSKLPKSTKKRETLSVKLCKESKLQSWGLLPSDIERAMQACNSNIEAFVAILDLYKEKQQPEAEYVLYKHPDLIYSFLDFELPKASLLVLNRNPYAIFQSQLQSISPGTGKPFASNSCCFRNQYVDFQEAQRNILSRKDVLQVTYEDLIQEIDKTMKVITSFLGLAAYNLSKDGKLFQKLLPKYQQFHQAIIAPPIVEKVSNWEGHIRNVDRYIIGQEAILGSSKKIVAKSRVIWLEVTGYFQYHLVKIMHQIRRRRWQ